MAATVKKKTFVSAPKNRARKSTSKQATNGKRSSKTAVKVVNAVPSENDIRLRAYQIYQEQGSEPGHDLEYWLQAENELMGA